MSLETKLKEYQIELGDLGAMPYVEGDRILIEVDTDTLTEAEASAKLFKVQQDMQAEFPGAKVIAHPRGIKFFILPKAFTDKDVGGRIISVETLV